MVTETRKVFAIAALIMATGIATVEMTRNTAQADPMVVAGGAEGYAGTRVESAFQLVAAIPAATQFAVAAAAKGDLQPLGCSAAANQCAAPAFDIASDQPAMIVEKRGASSSILIRLSRISVAGF